MPSEEVLGQITATTSTSTYQQTTEIATESEQNTINTEDRQSLRFLFLFFHVTINVYMIRVI